MKKRKRNRDGKDQDSERTSMRRIIEKELGNLTIASFYFNKEDASSHLTGFVHHYNENELLIAHITSRGEYDGFVLKRMEDLFRIEYNGEYEKKIHQLYLLKKQSHPIVECNEEDILFPLLNFAQKKQFLITLKLESDEVTGFVEEYDDYIHLLVVDENGNENGKSIVNIDDVLAFACDTDYEQDLKLIYNNSKIYE